FFEPAELTFELVGVSSYGVKADHLDCASRLVNVRAGVLERRDFVRRRLKEGERIQTARKRLVNLSLNPGQRSEIKIRCGVGSHVASSRKCRRSAPPGPAKPCEFRPAPALPRQKAWFLRPPRRCSFPSPPRRPGCRLESSSRSPRSAWWLRPNARPGVGLPPPRR